MLLKIENLHVEVEGKEVIKGLSFEVKGNERHVIMGPNGSGKSVLAKTILGYPKYKVTKGDILIDGESIVGKPPDLIAKKGVFLQFQDPVAVEGVNFVNFIKSSKESIANSQINLRQFMSDLKEGMEELGIDPAFTSRSINHGFSGGEKKKAEILQMLLLKPKLAILDEPDSGLDIDALKLVALEVDKIAKASNTSLIIITHYSRILQFIDTDYVHVLVNGKFVADGGSELVKKLEKGGYEAYL
ncbi:MAG: Fe-S cluster assembly ATPase SufC [Candidatus Micrarchaeia archaeon]